MAFLQKQGSPPYLPMLKPSMVLKISTAFSFAHSSRVMLLLSSANTILKIDRVSTLSMVQYFKSGRRVFCMGVIGEKF